MKKLLLLTIIGSSLANSAMYALDPDTIKDPMTRDDFKNHLVTFLLSDESLPESPVDDKLREWALLCDQIKKNNE